MDRLVWAATSTHGVAGWHLGVRTSDVEVDAALRVIFADRLVTDPPRPAPANFSLWTPKQDPERGAARLPTLFQGCTPVLRSRSVRRLVHALDGQMEDYRRVVRDDIVALEALAAVLPGTSRAAVLPRSVRYLQPALPQLLERHGLRVVDGMVLDICPTTGSLLVSPGTVSETIDDPRVLAALGPLLGRDDIVRPGRYDVSAWFRYGMTTRAEALVDVMRHDVRNRTVVGEVRALHALATTLRDAAVVPLRSSATEDAAAVARQVADHFRPA